MEKKLKNEADSSDSEIYICNKNQIAGRLSHNFLKKLSNIISSKIFG